MAKGDNPPVGILLCAKKDHALVEYALILALIAVFAIGALQALGTSVSDSLNYIASQIGGVVP